MVMCCACPSLGCIIKFDLRSLALSSLAWCCSRARLAGVSLSLSVVYLPGLLVSVLEPLFLWEGAVGGSGDTGIGNSALGGIMAGMPSCRGTLAQGGLLPGRE